MNNVSKGSADIDNNNLNYIYSKMLFNIYQSQTIKIELDDNNLIIYEFKDYRYKRVMELNLWTFKIMHIYGDQYQIVPS